MSTKEKKHLLIVEDDESVAEGLAEILSGYAYDVLCTDNAEGAMEQLRFGRVDLIILDICLGEENGYDLCRKIRKQWNTPIIFLTALNSEIEIVRGFHVGGDDYITKPFRMQELLVRIQALLRRSANVQNSLKRSGELVYDGKRQILYNAQGKMDLTGTELKIVKLLMEQWPRILTREELFLGIWDQSGMYVEENTLNVNISRLRDKLGKSNGTNYIETVRGTGYRWAVPVTGEEIHDR